MRFTEIYLIICVQKNHSQCLSGRSRICRLVKEVKREEGYPEGRGFSGRLASFVVEQWRIACLFFYFCSFHVPFFLPLRFWTEILFEALGSIRCYSYVQVLVSLLYWKGIIKVGMMSVEWTTKGDDLCIVIQDPHMCKIAVIELILV